MTSLLQNVKAHLFSQLLLQVQNTTFNKARSERLFNIGTEKTDMAKLISLYLHSSETETQCDGGL